MSLSCILLSDLLSYVYPNRSFILILLYLLAYSPRRYIALVEKDILFYIRHTTFPYLETCCLQTFLNETRQVQRNEIKSKGNTSGVRTCFTTAHCMHELLSCVNGCSILMNITINDMCIRWTTRRLVLVIDSLMVEYRGPRRRSG